jgi:hypothetical protein
MARWLVLVRPLLVSVQEGQSIHAPFRPCRVVLALILRKWSHIATLGKLAIGRFVVANLARRHTSLLVAAARCSADIRTDMMDCVVIDMVV